MEVREPVLWEEVVALIDDDDESVRLAAVRLIIETVNCWSTSFVEAQVVPIVIDRLLESDNRDVITAVLDGIGQLAYGLSDQLASNHEGLRFQIQKFIAVVAEGGGTELMEKLAHQFPGLAIALGPSHFPDITFSTLFNSEAVHEKVVPYIHELCKILGPEHTSLHLQPYILKVLSDELNIKGQCLLLHFDKIVPY